jgi:glycosyltransferase involved in cell wall biosynthesis
LRIVHILNHTNISNGHVHAAVDLACEQARLGHAVAVCSGGGDFDALLIRNGVEIFVVDHRRRVFAITKAIVKLFFIMRRWRPDVIHAHMMTSAILSVPVKIALRIALITTVHNEFERSSSIMRVGDRVIAVSEAVAKLLAMRKFSRNKLRVVLNGTIDVARRPHPGPAALDLRRPSVMFLGGLHPRKGVDDLIRAFAIVNASHPSTYLYIVGDGPHKDEYEQAVTKCGINDVVVFSGTVLDPRSFLRSADIFVLPSRADPAPLVISEAREAGCAIVASNVDGIPELLDNGAAGILVPVGDYRQLANSIISLIENPGRLSDYKRRALAGIERFSIKRVANETLAVYSECVTTS